MSRTIVIDPAMEKKLSDIAQLTNKDIGTVLEDLLTEGIAVKLDHLAALQESLDDLEAGRTFDHDDVMNEVRARIARVRAQKS